MTKAEEALHEALLFDGLEESQVPFEELKKAMCQHSIEFAEQVQGDGWILMGDSIWRNVVDPKIAEDDFRTTEQLYERFNNQEP